MVTWELNLQVPLLDDHLRQPITSRATFFCDADWDRFSFASLVPIKDEDDEDEINSD
jgi:hypothetical protein